MHTIELFTKKATEKIAVTILKITFAIFYNFQKKKNAKCFDQLRGVGAI